MPVQTAHTAVSSTLWNRNIDHSETQNISSLLFLLKSLHVLAVTTKKESNNGIVRGTRTFFCFKIETGCELGRGRACVVSMAARQIQLSGLWQQHVVF